MTRRPTISSVESPEIEARGAQQAQQRSQEIPVYCHENGGRLYTKVEGRRVRFNPRSASLFVHDPRTGQPLRLYDPTFRRVAVSRPHDPPSQKGFHMRIDSEMTVDDANRQVEALAAKAGTIVALGTAGARRCSTPSPAAE